MPAGGMGAEGIADAVTAYAKAQKVNLGMFFRLNEKSGANSLATGAVSGSESDFADGVPVNVLGLLDQMRVGLTVSPGSEHLHALLLRAAEERGPRECPWWEEEKSGVPAGDIC